MTRTMPATAKYDPFIENAVNSICADNQIIEPSKRQWVNIYCRTLVIDTLCAWENMPKPELSERKEPQAFPKGRWQE